MIGYITTLSFLLVEMESHGLLAWAGLKLQLLISASQVARIIDMSHCTLASPGNLDKMQIVVW
jgi:hypothetical protein